MRTTLLTSAAMLMTLLAATPISAEEAMDNTTAEATSESAMEPTTMQAEENAPVEATETNATETVTGTVLEMSGPAATPSPAIKVPMRGMHMNQVKQEYGQPTETSPPVGTPPITRWDYPGFAVYFEHAYVIHSVQK